MKNNKLVGLLLMFFVFSCSPIGPNYNKYNNHNKSVAGQMQQVYKYDKKSRKLMMKSRKCKRSIIKRSIFKTVHRKYIK
jgi:hypothetical protein